MVQPSQIYIPRLLEVLFLRKLEYTYFITANVLLERITANCIFFYVYEHRNSMYYDLFIV